MELLRSQPSIETWSSLSSRERERLLPEFRDIFFLTSSRKSFSTPEEREKFWRSWTEYYFLNEPAHIYIARSGDGLILGYLTGATDSRAAQADIAKSIPSFACFADQFDDFPAHLHINCHPNAQRMGLGRQLIDSFVSDLGKDHVSGVHVVTSPGEENVLFYRRLGFVHEVGRSWQGYSLLFMGRRL